MSATMVFTCDGCMKRFDLSDMGSKIIIGRTGHEPTSVLFHYCSSCDVPESKELAKAKPWYIIEEIIEKTVNGKVPRWLGRVHYNPVLRAFTDGHGDRPLM